MTSRHIEPPLCPCEDPGSQPEPHEVVDGLCVECGVASVRRYAEHDDHECEDCGRSGPGVFDGDSEDDRIEWDAQRGEMISGAYRGLFAMLQEVTDYSRAGAELVDGAMLTLPRKFGRDDRERHMLGVVIHALIAERAMVRDGAALRRREADRKAAALISEVAS